jgi:hypothetical protein
MALVAHAALALFYCFDQLGGRPARAVDGGA